LVHGRARALRNRRRGLVAAPLVAVVVVVATLAVVDSAEHAERIRTIGPPPTTAQNREAVLKESFPEPPWDAPPLSSSDTPGILIDAWSRSPKKNACPAMTFVDPGVGEGGQPRQTDIGGLWAVAWDKPGSPGMLADGYESPTAGRSTFGIAGVEAFPADPNVRSPNRLRWNDDSVANLGSSKLGEGYGEPQGENVHWNADVQISRNMCHYTIWTYLGREHLDFLLTQLRFVDNG
jgi:hypothetical protein